MANSEQMPKVDFVKDKAELKHTAIDYVKLINKVNQERALKFQRVRRNNIVTGCLLGGIAVGIYCYTIFAVKQERFLDDFEEPARISN